MSGDTISNMLVKPQQRAAAYDGLGTAPGFLSNVFDKHLG
jgi:hypothetical protein